MGFCRRKKRQDTLYDAFEKMNKLSKEVEKKDRRGWTDQQWVEEAAEIMQDLHGSVSSLLNGHVTAMLKEISRMDYEMARLSNSRDYWRKKQLENSTEIAQLRNLLRENGIDDSGVPR